MTTNRPPFDLTDRIALVTGAGSGLGRAFAETLAEAGAHVVCADRNADTAAMTATAIGGKGFAATSAEVDVADENGVNSLLAAIDARFQRLDILVNNAGISTNPARTHEFPVADFDRLMSINLRGVFLCTRAALPIMLRHRSGTIINIASILGLGGYYPGFPAIGVNYAASKAAVIGLTRQVALEYAGDGIRCNAIAPGWHSGTSLAAERRGRITPEEFACFERAVTAAFRWDGALSRANWLVCFFIWLRIHLPMSRVRYSRTTAAGPLANGSGVNGGRRRCRMGLRGKLLW